MTIEGAIAELQNLIKADDVPFYYNGAIQKVIETIIDERPVRCGECKYMRKYALRSDEPTGIWCHRWSVPRLVTDDDFCSYGERRADGNTIKADK